MPETRLRGQEVQIRLTQENVPIATVTAFKEFSHVFKGKVLEEGYLGETTMRYDDISDGQGGSFTVHAESQDVFIMFETIRARQRRQVSVQTTRFNATGRFSFPNGDTPKLFIKDMKFGEIPINVSGRDAFVGASIPYNSEDSRFITT